MCGIVACHGTGEAMDFLLTGLQRLEYRGYDSAGVAVADPSSGSLYLRRVVGRVETLRQKVIGHTRPPWSGLGIGHTRWATHGAVTETNAHPHHDCEGDVAVVHNGIVENAVELRAELELRGHRFASEVDTEVIAHLIEEARSQGKDLAAATRAATGQLAGSWALAVLARGCDRLVVAANRSPLVLAKADDGWYVASDVGALLERSREIRVLADGDIVEVNHALCWTDASGRPVPPRPTLQSGWTVSDVELGPFRDFMEKEIGEQPTAAARLLDHLLPLAASGELWCQLRLPPFARVRLVACGTSLHAAATTARVLRSVGRFPTELVVASEHEEALESGTLTLAFSQSGETADVLGAVTRCGGPVLAITNTPHSSLARLADAMIDCMAGPETGVAASKTFTAQVLAGAVVAVAAASAAGRVGEEDVQQLLGLLADLPSRLRRAHELSDPIAGVVAELVAEAPGFLLVSRGAGLPYAAEGALKLKELTYRWAEAYPAGELKHGPIALLERGTPVFVIQGGDAVKLESNVAEMRTRGAQILRVGGTKDGIFPLDCVPGVPWGPLEAVIALQHVARALAIRLRRDVDKPRNLAKSVTVE
jgi:glucosamine--fructose-6-phosphate aminotransferase (isomerizing)